MWYGNESCVVWVLLYTHVPTYDHQSTACNWRRTQQFLGMVVGGRGTGQHSIALVQILSYSVWGPNSSTETMQLIIKNITQCAFLLLRNASTLVPTLGISPSIENYEATILLMAFAAFAALLANGFNQVRKHVYKDKVGQMFYWSSLHYIF